jgi:hypothetical protein
MKIGKTIKPGQPGAKKWEEKYGDRLYSIRYRYDKKKLRKMITVEIIVENKPWKRNEKRIPHNKIVKLKAEYNEVYIRKLIKSAGGKWNNIERVWELPYSTTVDLGLENRIVLNKSVESFK